MSVFADLPLLIEPADLASRLHAPELILVDLTSPARYAQGHIEGAQFVAPARIQSAPPAPGLLPELSQLTTLFSELGHRQDAVYVVYDDEGGGWAGRFIWLLDVIGHSRYHVIDGGLSAWLDEQRPVTSQLPAPSPTQVQLTIHSQPTASLEYLQSRLHAPDLVIWDARSPAEYRGEKVLTARGGHIPGAINFEWTQGMDSTRALRMRSDLREHLATLGITPDKELITHCQTHHRSGFTYLAAKALGFPRVKGYAGSWGEWGNRSDTPIEV